jgi:ABC-type glycerol-3-phosphate transport system permease component
MKTIIRHLVIVLVCLVMLFPFVFVFLGATHDSGWAFQLPFEFTIGSDLWTNMSNIHNEHDILRVLFISSSTSLLTAGISLVLLTCASYAVAKYDFFGKTVIIYLMFIFLTLPQPTYLTGQLQMIKNLGMYSTFIGLVVPFVVNLRIFIYLRSIMKYIDDDLLDAARIDGAGELQTMKTIGIPMIRDKLILAFFLLFIASWNNFLIPLLIINKKVLITLPILISALADPMRYDVGLVFAGLFLSILPIIILFGLLQKHMFQTPE